MKHSTKQLGSIPAHFHLLPGFEPVGGLRVLGRTPVYWFLHRLDKTGRLELGRTRSRALQIEDKSVSCRHAEIQRVEQGYYLLRDLGSRNGVKVRERGHYGMWTEHSSGDPVLLKPGMPIKLGDVIIVPVDLHGQCPINARSQEEFARAAEETYGSASAAARETGGGRRLIRKIADKLGYLFS